MRTFFVLLGIFLTALVTTGVTAHTQQASPQGQTPATPAASLSGLADLPPIVIDTSGPQYQLVGTIKDIMVNIVDPSADVLWEAVATEITIDGILERRPRTDEEWAVVEHSAVTLAEAPNLLKMPGRIVARPGEKTQSEGPDAPELTAEQIQAKIDADPALWMKYANGLQNTAKKALEAVRRKDADALFDVGEAIDVACENCHLEYWYPEDKKLAAIPIQRR